MIGITPSREAIAAFQSGGSPTEPHEFAGIGHTIARQMREALVARVCVW
jgi:hypothetical protein